MTDLFKDKAQDWDARPVPARISEGVGAAMLAKVPLRPEMRVMDFGAGMGLICARVAAHVGTVYAVDISSAMLARAVSSCSVRSPTGNALAAVPGSRAVAHLTGSGENGREAVSRSDA